MGGRGGAGHGGGGSGIQNAPFNNRSYNAIIRRANPLGIRLDLASLVQHQVIPANIGSALNAIERFYQLVPELRGYVRRITGYDNERAYAAMGDRTLFLKLYGEQKMSVVNAKYMRDVAAHYHPNGTTVDAIIYHELGHAIEDMINDRYHKTTGYTADKIVLQAAKRFAAERDDNRRIETIDDAKTYAGYISRYSVGNHYLGRHDSQASFTTYETLAEAVGDYVEQGSTSHRFSQIIWEELMKELRHS